MSESHRKSFAATAFALYKTLAVSAPTVLDSALGRLTIAKTDERLRAWAEALLARAEVRLEVLERDRLPLKAALYMSNHQCHFDIPICYAVVPGTLRMVAKAELFRVPVWGHAMARAGFVSVDRSGNKDQARAAMAEAAQALQQGTSIWIAPEGTRSVTATLGTFKKGGFLLAQAAGVPIVPLGISGSAAILPGKSTVVRRGVEVIVTVGESLSIEQPLEVLMEKVRQFFLRYGGPYAAAK